MEMGNVSRFEGMRHDDGILTTQTTRDADNEPIMLTFIFLGRRSLSAQKKECAACGYPSAKTRKCM